jgi:uncharacterized membrane protein
MNKKSKKGTDVKASSNSLPSENDEIQLVQQIHRFSGPIPDPETLSQYKDLYPESIKIIMDMAVKQADHRQHMEKDSFALEREILKSESKQANLGRFSAVLIITLILGVIVFAIIKGESTIGSILAGALISISGIFALGKHYTKYIEKAKKKDKQ